MTAAAGGVLWRRDRAGLQVALVHRARYDDWSLPKGTVRPGENPLAAAVREVGEETGAEIAVSRRLADARYEVDGVPKTVAYWAMRHRGGAFVPTGEVDELRWLGPDDAAALLTYATDRDVLADFGCAPQADAVVLLVRHARAGKRTEWDGDDALRPLSNRGRRQADDLVWLLTAFGPTSVYAADRIRCQQTVEPLARRLDLTVRVDPVWSDESFFDGPGRTQKTLFDLAKPGSVTVVCSQGKAIPGLMERIGRGLHTVQTRKAGWWALTFVGGELLAADLYPPPR